MPAVGHTPEDTSSKRWKAHPDDRAGIALVATIDGLVDIDVQAREQNLTVIERDQLRQQKARTILESIKSQIETAKGLALPKSALAKACNYTLTFWNRLSRFLNHPILELSTNRRPERHPAGYCSYPRQVTACSRKAATLSGWLTRTSWRDIKLSA